MWNQANKISSLRTTPPPTLALQKLDNWVAKLVGLRWGEKNGNMLDLQIRIPVAIIISVLFFFKKGMSSHSWLMSKLLVEFRSPSYQGKKLRDRTFLKTVILQLVDAQ